MKRLFAWLRLLSLAGPDLLTHMSLHAELLQVEWAAERTRLRQMLLTVVFGFACAITLLLLSSVMVLALSWDTPYRIAALLGLLLIQGLACALTYWRWRLLVARGNARFAATREALAADIALLESLL